MDKQKLLAWAKKYRERLALTGLVASLIMFVGLGLLLQKTKQEQESHPSETLLKKVEFTPRPKPGNEQDGKTGKAHTYYLQPSPGELLEKLTAMQGLNDDTLEKQFVSLRVLWPAYFFSTEGKQGTEQVWFDMSEDGFGVVLRGDVGSADFPLLSQLKQGDKVWLGGEIAAVDPEGIGTVYLRMEYLDTEMPPDESAKIITEKEQ